MPQVVADATGLVKRDAASAVKTLLGLASGLS